MNRGEFDRRMSGVWLEIDFLQGSIASLAKKLKELEELGMTNATIHMRSDNGAMELLHRTGSDYEREHGRRREYIGKKEDQQDAARARVQRYQEHLSIRRELRDRQAKLGAIENRLSLLEFAARGKQAELFSKVGTDAGSRQLGRVPKNWDWLTPEMVIGYFQQSPDLASLAEDVQKTLKPFCDGDKKPRISPLQHESLSPVLERKAA